MGLKIGVIGVGNMGRNHVRNLASDKRFDLVGIYDTDKAQSCKISNRFGVKVFDDMDSLLKEVEAAVIAVPSSLHKETALRAAEYDVHVLIEKPLATTTKDAKIIKQAFNEKGLVLAIGHIERFNPVYKELKKLIANQDIFCIEVSRYSPYNNSGRITDTSVIEDLMIHDVDLVCDLMDGRQPTSIYGIGEKIKSKYTDFATCVMDFEGSGHAVVNASRISQNKLRDLTVHTANACIKADLLSKTLQISKNTGIIVDISGQSDFYTQEGVVQSVYVPIEEPLRAELISFYDSVVNGEPIIVDGNAGIRAIEICEAVAANAVMKGAC